MVNQNLLFLLEEVLGPSTPVNNDYVFYCPKCKHHKKKLSINLEQGYFHCWVCHFKGRGIKTLLIKSGYRNINIINQLDKEIQHSKISSKSIDNLFPQTDSQKQFISLPENCVSILENDSFELRRARSYLIGRGLSKLDMERYDIKYCIDNINELYTNRIIFPSYDCRGIINTFNARTIDDLFPKYREPAGIDKNSIIGLENLINWKLPIILVEGLMDALSVKHNAIPLFGTFIGKTLKDNILKNKCTVYICLDPEAFEYATRIADDLFQYNIDVYLCILPKNNDPSSLGYYKVWEYIKKSIKLDPEFLLKCKLFSRI